MPSINQRTVTQTRSIAVELVKRGQILDRFFEGRPSRILDRLDGRCEKVRGVQSEYSVFSLSNWKDGMVIKEEGKGCG